MYATNPVTSSNSAASLGFWTQLRWLEKKVADIFPLDGNLVVINPIMEISKSLKQSLTITFIQFQGTRYIKPKWYFGDDVSTPWKFNIAPENDGWKMSFLLRLPISRGYVKFSGCIMKRFTIIFTPNVSLCVRMVGWNPWNLGVEFSVTKIHLPYTPGIHLISQDVGMSHGWMVSHHEEEFHQYTPEV